MKRIDFYRRPVSLFVMVAFMGLFSFWADPLSSASEAEKTHAAARQQGDSHGPDRIEHEGKKTATVRKHKRFPWWLVAGGMAIVGVALYLLVFKKSGAAPADFDGDGRRVVVAEQFTATWCGYCPGASMGLDQLKDENPETLAVIAYHSSDEFNYANIYNSRSSYYGVSGIPDVFFDGTERKTGGSGSQSMYYYYKPMYDRRIAVSPRIGFKVVDLGNNTVQVEISNVSSQDLDGTFHFLIVEDNISFSWQNQNILRFVCRAMLPAAAGEMVSLAAGKMKVVTRSYAIAGAWNRSNCHIVAFMQGADKSIYQGIETDLPNG
jgi:thiol-disulfide isomerase/thioredoxin